MSCFYNSICFNISIPRIDFGGGRSVVQHAQNPGCVHRGRHAYTNRQLPKCARLTVRHPVGRHCHRGGHQAGWDRGRRRGRGLHGQRGVGRRWPGARSTGGHFRWAAHQHGVHDHQQGVLVRHEVDYDWVADTGAGPAGMFAQIIFVFLRAFYIFIYI